MRLLFPSILILNFSLFYSTAIYSQVDCKKTPKFEVNLNHDPAGSLKYSPMQDQDGLGTCFANTTSLLLEAWTGEPVSYHQIAINYGLGWKIPLLNNKAISSLNDNFIGEEGWVCGAIKSIKENGNKVCRRNDSPLEYLLENNDQEVLLKSLGSFYDSFQSQSTSDQKKIKDLIKASIQKSSDEKITFCEDDETLEKNAEESLLKFVEKLTTDLYPTISSIQISVGKPNEALEIKKDKEKFCKTLSENLGTFSIDLKNPESILDFSASNETIKKINNFLKLEFRNPSKLNSLNDRGAFYHRLMESMLNPENPGNMKYPLSDCVNTTTMTNILLSDDENTEAYINPTRLFSDPNYCLLSKSTEIITSEIDAKNSCESFEKGFSDLETVLEILKPNFSEHYLFTKNLLKTIENPDKSLEDFFKDLFEGTCLDKAIKIPDDLQCHWHLLPVRMNPIEKSITSAKEVEKFEREKTKKELNGIMSSQLLSEFTDTKKKGKPVEISVCSKFLKDSSHKASWNPKTKSVFDCSVLVNSEMHSMAVTGMRCQNGVIQYQVQNSWGQDCNYLDTPHKKNCDPKTGLFWVSEDVLAENIFEVSLLSRAGGNNNQSFKKKK